MSRTFALMPAVLFAASPGPGAAAPESQTGDPAAQEGPAIQHVVVYREPGRFGGWPANHGIWSWGDEILVGFSAGTYKDNGHGRHAIDHDRPEEHLLARSLDGGVTWTIENPSEKGALIPVGRALHGIPPPGLQEKPWQDCPGGIDFTHPDFAMTARMTDVDSGPSRFYCSTDRGHVWTGPFRLPLFGQKGIAARTDFIVNGPQDCMLFLTASKSNGKEGRPLCVQTQDGGRNWDFLSWIGDEPEGFSIMPSTVRLGANELLTAVRRHEGSRRWIETYRSLDNAQTWQKDAVPVQDTGKGNPASMIRLKEGRLCLTYGVRSTPYSICARLSPDGGKTWEKEIVLRDDGAGTDIGYPRSVQRLDGKVVTVTYFWGPDRPERIIAATVWDPDRASAARKRMRAAIAVERVFGPEDPGGRYKHPASITELANGDLYLAYYCGSGEYSDDTAIFAARRPKGQDGWTPPGPIADAPYRSEGNPVVWQAPDGKVWLFYVIRYGETWSTSLIMAKISFDGAQTWSDPILVTTEQGMMVRSRPLGLPGGDVLIPAYHETGHDTERVGPDSGSLFFRYDATTHAFTQTNKIRSRLGNIQPAVAPITDEWLVCYCRRGGDYSDLKDGRIVRSESCDGGRIWSEGSETEFKNPNAAVDFLRLQSGHHLLIYNDSTADRTPLTAALSTDGDKTYPHRRNLIEGPADFAYPYAIQAADGKIHLIFTSDGRTTLWHAVFEESDVMGHCLPGEEVEAMAR